MSATEDDGVDRPTVVIKKKARVFDGFLKVDEAVVSHPRYDGGQQSVTRQSLERGDSVAMVMVDRVRKSVWLVEQFRYPTFANGPGWIQELPAGAVDAGEAPERAAIREAIEEVGFEPTDMERIATVYASPGGSSERLILYFVLVDGATRDGDLAKRTQDPDEDIKLVDADLETFMQDARQGRLDDAKTMIAGLWLLTNRERLGI